MKLDTFRPLLRPIAITTDMVGMRIMAFAGGCIERASEDYQVSIGNPPESIRHSRLWWHSMGVIYTVGEAIYCFGPRIAPD